MFFQSKINFNHLNAAESLFFSFIMAIFYVSSLYLWSKNNRFKRDDPQVLFRRFISVSISCLFSLIFVYTVSQHSSSGEVGYCINEWLGFNFNLVDLKSLLVGFGLTSTFFLGPLVQDLFNIYLDYNYVYEHSSELNRIK